MLGSFLIDFISVLPFDALGLIMHVSAQVANKPTSSRLSCVPWFFCLHLLKHRDRHPFQPQRFRARCISHMNESMNSSVDPALCTRACKRRAGLDSRVSELCSSPLALHMPQCTELEV